MKVTQVAVRQSEASERAGRPALTPELLAASGARYSRNNEGLEAILSKIDPNNLDKSVDSIFKMIDYGHQSIADMVPVAMFIDQISVWLAYYVWTLCPTAGGQESSTRYIKLSVDDLVSPDQLGIHVEQVDEWRSLMARCFEAYTESLRIWEGIVAGDPNVTGIPRSLLEDVSEAAQKKVARMKRNYAFDRARYFLPVASATNIMLIMSARGWVALCQHLLSHPLPEAKQLGALIRQELELVAPRLIKHAREIGSIKSGILREFKALCTEAKSAISPVLLAGERYEAEAKPMLQVMSPGSTADSDFAEDLAFHDNRYAWVGPSLCRTAVRFGWSAVAFAEIRDLNRHRTGSKHSPQIPQGFYCAEDQMLGANSSSVAGRAKLHALAQIGKEASVKAHDLLRAEEFSYLYWTVLGTQYPFEHLTTADKFIYEAELRTGAGAHFRYTKHLRDALSIFYAQFPKSKGLIIEGSAEPE